MIKKVFWISLAFFLLSLVFLGVYQFAFKHNVNDPVADPEKKAALTAKEEEPEVIKSLAFEEFVHEPVLFPGAERTYLFYYSSREKSIKRVAYDGDETSVIMANVPGEPKRLLWSPNFTGAVALLARDGRELWHYIDFRSQNITPLKPEMSRLAWNTLGDGIFYQFTDGQTGERSINTSDFDGSNWKKLVDLGKEDHFLATIPQSSQVSFWTRPNGLMANQVERVSITGEGRKVVHAGRFGGDYLWSPNGHWLLVGGTETRGSSLPLLGIVDENGGNYRDLKTPTLINKVAWSQDNETLYYALPGAFSPGTILPNDYFEKPISTKDTFWKMNLKTGKRERLVPLDEMEQAFDATNLFLAPDETRLFFVDRKSGKLYHVNL